MSLKRIVHSHVGHGLRVLLWAGLLSFSLYMLLSFEVTVVQVIDWSLPIGVNLFATISSLRHIRPCQRGILQPLRKVVAEAIRLIRKQRTLLIPLGTGEPVQLLVDYGRRCIWIRLAMVLPNIPAAVGPCRLYRLGAFGVHKGLIEPVFEINGRSYNLSGFTDQDIEWLKSPVEPTELEQLIEKLKSWQRFVRPAGFLPI